MATRSEKLTELEAELVAVKAAMAAVISDGKSVSLSGMSVTRADLPNLSTRRTEIEKSIQRLINGGRGMHIDMGGGPYA